MKQDKKPAFKAADKADFVPFKREEKEIDTKATEKVQKAKKAEKKVVEEDKEEKPVEKPVEKPETDKHKMTRGKKGYTRKDAVISFINVHKDYGFTMGELNKGQEEYYLRNVPNGKKGAVCSNICSKVVKSMIKDGSLIKDGRTIKSA